ncbi:MAG: SRPBCC family protein [Acidimicrobiales bacterium]
MTKNVESAELEVRRVVAATPEQVFEAWTSPAALLDWWGPPGGSCQSAAIDLQVGGSYRITNSLPDDSTVTIVGQFLDVVPPSRLSYTWTTDAGAQSDEIVTVLFKPHNGGTEVVVSHQRIASPEGLGGHEAGWQACLSGLVAYFA